MPCRRPAMKSPALFASYRYCGKKLHRVLYQIQMILKLLHANQKNFVNDGLRHRGKHYHPLQNMP